MQPMASPFVDPSVGGGLGLKVRDLENRVVIMIPTSYNPSAPALEQGKTQEQIIADVFVISGPSPLRFGSNITTGSPDTHSVAVPYYATGVMLSHVNIVRALKPHVGTGIVLGRIERGTTQTRGNSRPWNLQPLADSLSPAQAQGMGIPQAQIDSDRMERERAGALWADRTVGTFVNPTPVSLTAPQAQQQYQPTQYPQVQQQPAQAQYQQQPTQYPQAQQQPAQAQYQLQPAPAAADIPCPAGWNSTVWAGLSPQNKAQIAASMAPAATDPMNQPTGF